MIDIYVNGNQFEVPVGQLVDSQYIRNLAGVDDTYNVYLLVGTVKLHIQDGGGVVPDNGARFITEGSK
jgi:hypothetical protein